MSTKVKGDKIKEGSIPLSAMDDDFKFRYYACPSEIHSNVEYIDITNFKVGDTFTINRNVIGFYIGLKSVDSDKCYNEVWIGNVNGKTAEIPYNESTITVQFNIGNNCFYMTIKSGINTGSECILEIYNKSYNTLDNNFISRDIARVSQISSSIYWDHLATMIDFNQEDMVVDDDDWTKVIDYTGRYYSDLEDLIYRIRYCIAYSLSNFMMPQLHLSDWEITLPAITCYDPRPVANEEGGTTEELLNMLQDRFEVRFGGGSSNIGGVELYLYYQNGELHFELYEY